MDVFQKTEVSKKADEYAQVKSDSNRTHKHYIDNVKSQIAALKVKTSKIDRLQETSLLLSLVAHVKKIEQNIKIRQQKIEVCFCCCVLYFVLI